ncbi:hypothetical protein GF336_01510 [Candidatus Woesearchaeota archaeon]|nr:hypothetical protein [Candidatus Woesearchaeota archaeon]
MKSQEYLSEKKPELFEFEDIAESRDILLFDTSGFEMLDGAGVSEALFESHIHLNLDQNSLSKRTEFVSGLACMINKYNDKIDIVPEVIVEAEDYMDILNEQLKFHKNILDKKKSQKKVYSRNRRETHRRMKMSASEKDNLEMLRLYVDNYYHLLKEAKNCVSDKRYNGFLEQVKDLAKKKNIKRDFSFRYRAGLKRPGNRRKEDLYTDEKIAVRAYEHASKGNKVAIISNDSDLRNILDVSFTHAFGWNSGLDVSMYCNYRHGKYNAEFDSKR